MYDAPPTQSPHLHAAPPPPKPSSPRAAPSLQQWTPKISGTGAGPAAVAGSVAAACAKFDTLDTIFQAELDAARTRLTVEPTLQLGASDAVSASSGSEAVAGSRCAPSSQASLHQTAPSPSLSSTLSALVQTQKLLARQHARLSSVSGSGSEAGSVAADGACSASDQPPSPMPPWSWMPWSWMPPPGLPPPGLPPPGYTQSPGVPPPGSLKASGAEPVSGLASVPMPPPLMPPGMLQPPGVPPPPIPHASLGPSWVRAGTFLNSFPAKRQRGRQLNPSARKRAAKRARDADDS